MQCYPVRGVLAVSEPLVADIQISLLNCTQVIETEIAEGLSQTQIAITYAMALASEASGADAPDWGTINRAILSKWKMSGLQRIKKRAWDIAEGRGSRTRARPA